MQLISISKCVHTDYPSLLYSVRHRLENDDVGKPNHKSKRYELNNILIKIHRL